MLSITGFFLMAFIGAFIGWMSRILGLGRDFGLTKDLLLGADGALLGWFFAYAVGMYQFGANIFLFMAAFGAVGFLFIVRFSLGRFA